jgi:hypothetical protein
MKIKQSGVYSRIIGAAVIAMAGACVALPADAQTQPVPPISSELSRDPGAQNADQATNPSPSILHRGQTRSDPCAGLSGNPLIQCAKAHPQQQLIQSQDRPIGKTPNS